MNRFALVGFVLLPFACAADWPQFLGPNRDGASAETVEPWQGELKVLWRQPVGEGHSSPVVAGGRVFALAKVAGKEAEELVAFEAATGKELWRARYQRPPFSNFYGNGPRSTPLVNGDRVYTLGVSGVLACWQASDGKEVWKTNILAEFKASNLFFGMSTTPVIAGEHLLVMVGGPDAGVVAFHKKTGKTAWMSVSDKSSYSSPIVTTHKDRALALCLMQSGLIALDPASGRELWRFPLVDRLSESSTTPVRSGDVVLASSVTYGSVGLKLTEKDGKPAHEQLWKNEKLTCYFSTPVAFGEQFYVVTGQVIPPAAALHCVEASSGKVLWTRPKVGTYHATVMRVKDRLLLLEEEGQLVLFEPSTKEYKELARARVCGKTWAHPALSDGRLFVRDDKELICVQLGKE